VIKQIFSNFKKRWRRRDDNLMTTTNSASFGSVSNLFHVYGLRMPVRYQKRPELFFAIQSLFPCTIF